MEGLADLSWKSQIAFGTLERFEVSGFQVTAVSGGKGATYRYRLLFFPPLGSEPVYAVNLEQTILGDQVLSEQIGKRHHTLEQRSVPHTYESFRIAALERALVVLPSLQ
ncbi:MAG: hypothetical protein SNJ56_05025 [Termitinemataceae bacterium]